jgi:hypothetical protein
MPVGDNDLSVALEELLVGRCVLGAAGAVAAGLFAYS